MAISSIRNVESAVTYIRTRFGTQIRGEQGGDAVLNVGRTRRVERRLRQLTDPTGRTEIDHARISIPHPTEIGRITASNVHGAAERILEHAC